MPATQPTEHLPPRELRNGLNARGRRDGTPHRRTAPPAIQWLEFLAALRSRGFPGTYSDAGSENATPHQ